MERPRQSTRQSQLVLPARLAVIITHPPEILACLKSGTVSLYSTITRVYPLLMVLG